jgi:HEAT repeat protein
MKTTHAFLAGALFLGLVAVSRADVPKPSDVPPLIVQLTYGAPKVRASAAKEIGRIGTIKASYVKEAIPVLLRAAKDKDDDVRKAALHALGLVEADPEQAVPVLLEGLKSSNDQVRIAAAEGLGHFGADAKEALPELKKISEEINQLPMPEKNKRRPLMQAANEATRDINQALRSARNAPKKKK